MKTLSIIIVTYCSDDFISDCLSSIYSYNDLGDEEIEVIIVDNSPSASNLMKQIVGKFPNVRLISNPKNGGFGQGNNVGAVAASGKILLFLNPDTKFIEPVFCEVIKHFGNGNVRAVGCQLVDGEGHKTNTYGYFPEKWSLLVSIIDKCVFKPLGYIPKFSIYPWGANFFVRRKDFYAAGKFDEGLFLFHEESDLCQRLSPKETHIIKQKIIHYGGHTSIENSKRFEVWLKSLVFYHEKYGYDLNQTLGRYKRALFLSLLRRFFLGQGCCDLRNMIGKLTSLQHSLTKQFQPLP